MTALVSIDRYQVALASQEGLLPLYHDNWHIWRDFKKFLAEHDHTILFYDGDGYHSMIIPDAGTSDVNFFRIAFKYSKVLKFTALD
jgi:hypothetical protein